MRISIFELETPYGLRLTIKGKYAVIVHSLHDYLLGGQDWRRIREIFYLKILDEIEEVAGMYEFVYVDVVRDVPGIDGCDGWSYFLLYLTNCSDFDHVWKSMFQDGYQVRRLLDISGFIERKGRVYA